MRANEILALVVLAATLGGCSSVSTRYDYDPNVVFDTWQTYAWYESDPPSPGDMRVSNALLHGRLVSSIDQSLAGHGFTLAEGDVEPDFLVSYHLSVDRSLDVRTVNRSYQRSSVHRSWGSSGWGGVGWSETHVREVERGTLLIDLIDVEASRLAWRGTGTRRIPSNLQSDRLTSTVNEAVDQILQRFPPSQ